ncbi:MAG TPA: ComF family protein, partial [Planctomycetaceae bacterium]|nr:ComF family protein [Planctomycetaceae bacterium]
AFVVKHSQCLKGRHVFLVDDVLTSGATAAEVAKVVRAAGASSVDILVVARGTGTRSL